MSDATPNREWRFCLDDMIGFCERVQTFTRGLDQIRFVGDIMRFDATVRNIELIGGGSDPYSRPGTFVVNQCYLAHDCCD